jgi:predicted nucleic acid-binding protein
VSVVFVDTAAWIARVNRDDNLHASTVEVLRQLNQRQVRLVTTEFVLIEVADALSSPAYRQQTVRFIEGLRTLSLLTIVPLSDSLLEAGWALYRARADKAWGLTDCTSFAVMTERGISDALTSDHHFQQAGFRKLL